MRPQDSLDRTFKTLNEFNPRLLHVFHWFSTFFCASLGLRYGIPSSIYGKMLQFVFHFSSAICLGIANALQTPSLKLSVLQRPRAQRKRHETSTNSAMYHSCNVFCTFLHVEHLGPFCIVLSSIVLYRSVPSGFGCRCCQWCFGPSRAWGSFLSWAYACWLMRRGAWPQPREWMRMPKCADTVQTVW